MLSRFIMPIVALQAGLAVAGNAIISNLCPYDIWVWSVDQSYWSAPRYIPARTQYSEPFRSSCIGCGTSMKISKSDQLLGGSHTQSEYSIVNDQIWYDISFVDCAKGESASDCPGHDLGLAMDSPQQACGKATCAGGSYCPTQAYYVDFPMQKLGLRDPVFTCPGIGAEAVNLHMKVCSDEAPLKRSIAGRLAIQVDG